MVTETKRHTKGQVAPGKTPVNWRLLTGNVNQLDYEAQRLGYSSVPAFVNAFWTRYFNTEPGGMIQREPL